MEWRYHVWGVPHCAAASNPKVKLLELTQKQVGQYFATISSSSSLKELSCFRAVKLNQPAYPISVSLRCTIHCLCCSAWVVLDRELCVLVLVFWVQFWQSVVDRPTEEETDGRICHHIITLCMHSILMPDKKNCYAFVYIDSDGQSQRCIETLLKICQLQGYGLTGCYRLQVSYRI